MNGQAQIVLEGVTHTFRPPRGRSVQALADVSLEVRRREFVGTCSGLILKNRARGFAASAFPEQVPRPHCFCCVLGVSFEMKLPSGETCQRILALHQLLGFTEGKDEKRTELLKVLGECELTWNSLAEFFATMNVGTATVLPVAGSKAWAKRCQKICQLHAAMGSSAKDGAVAHQKLIDRIARQQFSWSSDLPTILAADWTFRNPPLSSGMASPSSASEVDVFVLTRAVIEDRVVLPPAASAVAALIAMNSHVYEQFAFVPQLGIVAPSSGRGKSRLLTVLQRLVARPWASIRA